MNTSLLLAAAGLALVGLAHSVLGEILVFRQLRRTRGLVPTAGQPVLRERQVRILWGTWHVVALPGVCAAEGASAATRDKPVSRGTTACAQGATLGWS
ncbi:hypothetical protein ACOQFS_05565, partial [Paracidovorax sp. MALMAid1276]